jgi:hypothetical protein
MGGCRIGYASVQIYAVLTPCRRPILNATILPATYETMHSVQWTTELRIRTRARPSTERIVSITVQDLNVSITVSPKYSFTSQNPASFTCERINDPEPVARTINSRLTVGSRSTIWATRPVAVIVATVAEPVAIRTRAAMPQPSSNGEIFRVCCPHSDQIRYLGGDEHLLKAASADDKNNRSDRSKTISNHLQRFARGPTGN